MAAGAGGHVDLTDKIVKKELFALNVAKGCGPENLFAGGGDALLCKSEDSQLIVHVPFNEPCRVFSFVFSAPAGSEPTTIKVYVNRPTFDFSDAEEEPVQVIKLKPEDFGAKEHKTKYAKFQAVTALDFFIENEAGDSCALSGLKVVGESVIVADVRAIKKVGEE